MQSCICHPPAHPPTLFLPTPSSPSSRFSRFSRRLAALGSGAAPSAGPVAACSSLPCPAGWRACCCWQAGAGAAPAAAACSACPLVPAASGWVSRSAANIRFIQSSMPGSNRSTCVRRALVGRLAAAAAAAPAAASWSGLAAVPGVLPGLSAGESEDRQRSGEAAGAASLGSRALPAGGALRSRASLLAAALRHAAVSRRREAGRMAMGRRRLPSRRRPGGCAGGGGAPRQLLRVCKSHLQCCMRLRASSACMATQQATTARDQPQPRRIQGAAFTATAPALLPLPQPCTGRLG